MFHCHWTLCHTYCILSKLGDYAFKNFQVLSWILLLILCMKYCAPWQVGVWSLEYSKSSNWLPAVCHFMWTSSIHPMSRGAPHYVFWNCWPTMDGYDTRNCEHFPTTRRRHPDNFTRVPKAIWWSASFLSLQLSLYMCWADAFCFIWYSLSYNPTDFEDGDLFSLKGTACVVYGQTSLIPKIGTNRLAMRVTKVLVRYQLHKESEQVTCSDIDFWRLLFE